jgi:hypothetical protein
VHVCLSNENCLLEHDELFAGDVFVLVAPIENDENVKYYLMRCTQGNMNLLEYFYDNDFIYEREFIVLKGYFFQETHQIDSHVHFHDYQSDVTSCQYSHLVCKMHINLIEVQSRKRSKVRKWKMSKVDHERIIEDGISL